MRNTTKEAFCEVYDIIKHMDKEMQEKIPNNFMNLIKENKALNYEFNIDYKKDIKNQILRETKIILSLIYRDYLCSSEKREELLALDIEEIRREEKSSQEKYKIDYDSRKKEKLQDVEELKNKEQETLPIKVEKDKWYIKIINFIKKILKR